MCLAKAYIGGNSDKELLMDEIASVQVADGKLLIKTLFGEERVVEGSIREIDFMGSHIVLESAAESR
jgi:predicted RNA-binding protein